MRTLGANDAAYFRNDAEGGLRLQQVPEELDQLAAYLVHRHAGRTVRYLEVGVGSFATCIVLAQLFRQHGIGVTLSAVDNFDYEQRGIVTEQHTRRAWCEAHLGLRFTQLDTRTPDFVQWLSGQTFDVILVDGDHSFSGCLWDTVQCSRALAPDGVLVLHDVTSWVCPGVGEVFSLAREVATAHHVYSVGNTCGIGVLEGLAESDALRTAAMLAALGRVDNLEARTADLTALTSSPRAVLTRALPQALEARRRRRATN